MFNEKELNWFVQTALERHRIYKKKETGAPKPWTSDEVFQQFFFCNLFRQYDKCTKWIVDNVLPYKRWDLTILYRFISTYELFEGIKETVDMSNLKEVEKYLCEMRKLGTMFSGCFLRNPRIKGEWVETYQAPFIVIEQIRKVENLLKNFLETGTLQEMVGFLKQFPGIGGFMGYEYACDFAYTEMFNPSDTMTWANMGPGAQRGMSLLLYGSSEVKMKENVWLSYARELFVILKQRVESEFPEEDVSMREVEHWLCEYAKYRKYMGVLEHGYRVKYRHYGGLE